MANTGEKKKHGGSISTSLLDDGPSSLVHSESKVLDSPEEISKRKLQLSDLQVHVTQNRCTERPFSNKYNSHFEEGYYNCVVCNTRLFDSQTKFKSTSGWPAFSNVVDKTGVKLTPDVSHVGANLLLLIAKPDLARTEVSCANCNAHLGHLFKDGPKPTGLRYCINSSSLLFVPSNPPPSIPSPGDADNIRKTIVTETTSKSAGLENNQRSSGLQSITPPLHSQRSSAKLCFFQPSVRMSPTL